MNTETPRTGKETSRIQCDLNSMKLDDWSAAFREMKSHAETLERELNEMQDFAKLCEARAMLLEAMLKDDEGETEETRYRWKIKAGMFRSIGLEIKQRLESLNKSQQEAN